MANALAGIARGSLLVDLSISTYSGRKQDKATRDEVTANKGAKSKRAASVYKSLFADCPELDAITRFQSKLRIDHYRLTQPWSDSGPRLVAMGTLEKHRDLMYHAEREFDALVTKFLDKYDTLVAAAAFQLGALFDRNEYPLRSQVRRKFSFNVVYTPLPTSGDFRIDVENEVQRELIAQFEQAMAEREARMAQDSWTRLHKVLTRMIKQLAPRADGKRGKIYDTLLGEARDLCDLLTHFNMSQDPSLERARLRLIEAMDGVTTDALKVEADTRVVVHDKVKAILADYEWGIEDVGSGEEESELDAPQPLAA